MPEENVMNSDQTLDCVGLYCPMPIVKTSQQIKKMKVGEILEIASDDKGIKEDMPAWCKATGNELLGIEEQGGEIKVYIKKVKE
jgi:tRNA 2-thiouridine synthesizing protein A